MSASANFRMSDGDDVERLEARVRANARDYAQAAGDNALIGLLANLMRAAQTRMVSAGRARR